MKSFWIAIGAVILVGLVGIGQYNSLVGGRESITQSWSQVENTMQRRADLIPNLVETVKGYAKHEKEIMTAVVEARAKLGGAKTVQDKMDANDHLGAAISRLLMIVENYPQLKANENFARLQDELAGTENRIAVERMRYIESVRAYNTSVKRFPGNLIAGMFSFQPSDAYFKATEAAKEVPAVKF